MTENQKDLTASNYSITKINLKKLTNQINLTNLIIDNNSIQQPIILRLNCWIGRCRTYLRFLL
jgi:hypothetical protein